MAITSLDGSWDGNDILLTWLNDDTYDTHKVYRSDAGGGYNLIDTIDGAEETYTDSTVTTTNIRYAYKLYSQNSGSGAWSWSNTVTFNVAWTDSFTATVTTTPTETNTCQLADTITVTVTITPKVMNIQSISQNFGVYLGDEIGNVYEYSDSYITDAGSGFTRTYQTKALDFQDVYPQYGDLQKTIEKIRVIYKDIYSSTPIQVSISNDGSNWDASLQYCGTGSGKIKTKDFYFAQGNYISGRIFYLKIDFGSAVTTTDILGIEIHLDIGGNWFEMS